METNVKYTVWRRLRVIFVMGQRVRRSVIPNGMDLTVMYIVMMVILAAVTFVTEKLVKESVVQTGMDLAVLYTAKKETIPITHVTIKQGQRSVILNGLVQIVHGNAKLMKTTCVISPAVLGFVDMIGLGSIVLKVGQRTFGKVSQNTRRLV